MMRPEHFRREDTPLKVSGARGAGGDDPSLPSQSPDRGDTPSGRAAFLSAASGDGPWVDGFHRSSSIRCRMTFSLPSRAAAPSEPPCRHLHVPLAGCRQSEALADGTGRVPRPHQPGLPERALRLGDQHQAPYRPPAAAREPIPLCEQPPAGDGNRTPGIRRSQRRSREPFCRSTIETRSIGGWCARQSSTISSSSRRMRQSPSTRHRYSGSNKLREMNRGPTG